MVIRQRRVDGLGQALEGRQRAAGDGPREEPIDDPRQELVADERQVPAERMLDGDA